MTCSRRFRLFGSLFALTVSTVDAEPSSPLGQDSNKARLLSPTLALAITKSLPKYVPPSSKDASDQIEAFDLPKPRNGIIRLPTVVVEGNRPTIFTEREIYTDKGLAEIAVKRYFNDTGLALNRFRLPLVGMTKEAYAMLLWQEDLRLGQIRKFAEQATLDETLGHDGRAAELRLLINDTLGHIPLFLGAHRAPYRDARGQ